VLFRSLSTSGLNKIFGVGSEIHIRKMQLCMTGVLLSSYSGQVSVP